MINPKDLKILSSLRENARMNLTTMARQTRIPTSTLFDRIKMQERSLVKGYTSLLDFTKLGYRCRASVLLKSHERQELADYLANHPNVNNLFKLGNGFDFGLELVFRSSRELREFLKQLREQFLIETLELIPITGELKREGFLSKPSKLLYSVSDRLRP